MLLCIDRRVLAAGRIRSWQRTRRTIPLSSHHYIDLVQLTDAAKPNGGGKLDAAKALAKAGELSALGLGMYGTISSYMY